VCECVGVVCFIESVVSALSHNIATSYNHVTLASLITQLTHSPAGPVMMTVVTTKKAARVRLAVSSILEWGSGLPHGGRGYDRPREEQQIVEERSNYALTRVRGNIKGSKLQSFIG
jgi:hypothetical protein